MLTYPAGRVIHVSQNADTAVQSSPLPFCRACRVFRMAAGVPCACWHRESIWCPADFFMLLPLESVPSTPEQTGFGIYATLPHEFNVDREVGYRQIPYMYTSLSALTRKNIRGLQLNDSLLQSS